VRNGESREKLMLFIRKEGNWYKPLSKRTIEQFRENLLDLRKPREYFRDLTKDKDSIFLPSTGMVLLEQ